MQHNVVSQSEWLAARKALLVQGKGVHQGARSIEGAARRALPWVKVEKNYVFEGPNGRERCRSFSPAEASSSSTISCSAQAGSRAVRVAHSSPIISDGAVVHLAQRDVTFVVVSRAPFAEIEAYKSEWDGHSNGYRRSPTTSIVISTSRSPRGKERGKVEYNYTMTEFPSEEAPGLSAFIKNETGEVLHTYSSYARGLDILVGTYNFLDMAPKGRDEDALPWSMAWVRRHDEYQVTPPKAGCCG